MNIHLKGIAVMKNKLNILGATFLLIAIQQSCLATDYDPLAPPATSVQGAGSNNSSEVNLAIQQSDLPAESKHVEVLYLNGSVVLRGIVNSDRDRQLIGGIAEKCGCVSIKNELKVAQTGTKTKAKTTSHKGKFYYPSH